MEEFRGLKINGIYELKDEDLGIENDVEISDITSAELIGILCVIVINVLNGAYKEKSFTFLEMFNKAFNHLVEEYRGDTNDK